MTNMNKYMRPRGRRREYLGKTGTGRGGKLYPVMAHPVRGSEGGMLSQSIRAELAPIAGRLISEIMCETYTVFVPVQAMDEIKDPANVSAGLTDIVREKLLTGNPLFNTEAEGEISQRCGVEPRRVGGVARVSEAVRLAHNCAVNHLRQKRYDKAALLLHTNTAITNAILSETVLDKLNAVLDPDDRINGQVSLNVGLTLPAADLKVEGVGWTTASTTVAGVGVKDTNLGATTYANSVTDAGGLRVRADAVNGNPNVIAKLNSTVLSGTSGNVSLDDFYNAETMDRLVREMDGIIDEYKQYGEEAVQRWAHGLAVDPGKMPMVIVERRTPFNRRIVGAMDSAGITNELMRSDFTVEFDIMVPVPKTELGGILITFLVVKPDETLASQPHPFLSDAWVADNFVADELMLDPVAVTARELDSGIASGSESTVMCYTGYNQLKRDYRHYGFTRNTNLSLVQNKTAIWQLAIPMSVTPNSVLYPDALSHYPFVDQAGDVVTYTIDSLLTLDTPMIVGPTPVETIAVINNKDLFDLVP